MDKQALIDAIEKSGGGANAIEEADELIERIDFLEKTGRYTMLLSRLTKANDKSNFLALVLEINFAYQFESRDRELLYEVKQDPQYNSSIDFLRVLPDQTSVFFELRLLQRAQRMTESMNTQLQEHGIYSVAMGGEDEQDEVVRIQNTILSKVQDKDGKPLKFLSSSPDAVNIVVVDATESILGTIDIHDCMLATHGDPSVEEPFRRGIFGLFQVDRPEYPERIHALAAKYAHIASTLYGVLFLFKEPGSRVLAYRIEQLLIWNPAMIDSSRARTITADISAAILVRREPNQ